MLNFSISHILGGAFLLRSGEAIKVKENKSQFEVLFFAHYFHNFKASSGK